MSLDHPESLHVFYEMDRCRLQAAVDFILSGQLPGELLSQKNTALARDVMAIIRADAPQQMAMTNPDFYRTLRGRITELRIAGYL